MYTVSYFNNGEWLTIGKYITRQEAISVAENYKGIFEVTVHDENGFVIF